MMGEIEATYPPNTKCGIDTDRDTREMSIGLWRVESFQRKAHILSPKDFPIHTNRQT